MPRTTGAVSGLLILVLGVWGGLIPFIGPYFHYAFGGTSTWHYTTQRLWLDIVPGAVAVIGGFMLLTAATRTGGITAAWVAIAAGAWFIVGPAVSLIWHHTLYAIGAPLGGATRQMIEWIGYFFGLGTVIVGLAAFAMGRYLSRPRLVEEPVAAAGPATAAVADRPVADRAVADRPVADRLVADRGVADRPVAGETAAGTAPANTTAAGTAPADTTAAGTAPANTTAGGAAAAPPRRRFFGLFGRRRSRV